ncbi:MAG TPA: organomercurial lyase [Stellaceae bacterium]|nr:organomercurial lyase [Stellaceae bacterium]
MAGRDRPTVDQYWETLAPLLKSFSPEEQNAAVTLYRELAKGRAVDAAQFARALDTTPTAARALLERDVIKRFIYPDAQGRVLGFGGLAAAPMHHRFEVNGRSLWTWCAWDSLFIPEILGRPARVTSPDPENRELVRLTVTPDRIESVEPGDAVISFTRLDAEAFGTSATNIMASFCHYIFFFASRASGERWTAKHTGTFLCTLDDAFALAKRLNAANFGTALRTHMAVGHRI